MRVPLLTMTENNTAPVWDGNVDDKAFKERLNTAKCPTAPVWDGNPRDSAAEEDVSGRLNGLLCPVEGNDRHKRS